MNMVSIEVTEKIGSIVEQLSSHDKYMETLAFVSEAQEAAIEARSALTSDQTWVLFTAIQEYKCLIDELANYQNHFPPSNLGLYKEEGPVPVE